MADYVVRDRLALWWLADPARPRLVGTLHFVRRSARQPGGVGLEYADGWLADGIALSEDLPLKRGLFLPSEEDAAAGAVDDARPDRWGERVIRLIDRPPRLSTLEYLFFAGDDRFGALGVSDSDSTYSPRRHGPLPVLADVPAMHELVRRVEAGEPVDDRLRRLVAPGASFGGARPKALVAIDGMPWLIKFGVAGDPLDSPLVEHAAMTLARQAGIDVCETRPVRLDAGHAVAVRRFDRADGRRRHALSACVALRAAGEPFGYPELALLLRRRAPADRFAAEGEQLFRRMIFNILIDNTDDHEKNHVLLVDDAQRYGLSLAFDIQPSGQALGYQQMRVGRDGHDATLDNALSEHRSFALGAARAREVAADVARTVGRWHEHFASCGVTPRDLDLLSQHIDREFLRRQRQSLA